MNQISNIREILERVEYLGSTYPCVHPFKCHVCRPYLDFGGTVYACIEFVDKMLHYLDDQHTPISIFLGLSKAFDSRKSCVIYIQYCLKCIWYAIVSFI